MLDKPRISPSLIKDYWKYRNKQMCGLLFEAKWVDRIIPTTPYEELSDLILYGYRFEFQVTGAIPNRHDEEPPMLTTASGKPSAKQAHLDAQAERCKRALEYYNFAIPGETSFLMEYDPGGTYTMKCYQDIKTIRKGEQCFIDLKSTGMLDNKWEDTGWGMEKLQYKTQLMIQPAFAILSAREVLHIEHIPYYFYVASNTNPDDARFIQIRFDERTLLEYFDMIEDVGTSVFVEQDLGFTPIPDYKRCKDCPLREKCEHRIDVPHIDLLIIGGE